VVFIWESIFPYLWKNKELLPLREQLRDGAGRVLEVGIHDDGGIALEGMSLTNYSIAATIME
jgi:hypothetical protein